MRYVLQAAVMLGDVLFVTALVVLIYFAYDQLFIWLMIAYGVHVWNKQGGFIAWRKKDRQQFMRNAKRFGL